MEYISEDYCSEELSGMLMEKGYIGATNTYLGKDDIKVEQITLQSAMKWLRNKHNIFIEIGVDEMLKDNGYYWALYYNSTKEIMPYADWETSYEETCEEAIRYCLENLI